MAKDTIAVESMYFYDDQVFGVLCLASSGVHHAVSNIGNDGLQPTLLRISMFSAAKILSVTRSFQQRVLAMDCNDYSRMWNPAFISENRLGEIVEGFLGSEDLFIVNRPKSPATCVNELGLRSWIGCNCSITSTDGEGGWMEGTCRF